MPFWLSYGLKNYLIFYNLCRNVLKRICKRHHALIDVFLWTLCSRRKEDRAVDPFVQSQCLSLKHAGCEGKGQMVSFTTPQVPFKLIQKTIGVPPDPLVLSLCTPEPKTVCKTRHNYSRKWNYHNIYSRLKQNISEHFSSEKPPPSSTYSHKTAFMLEDNRDEEVVLAVFGNDLTRPAVWPRLGSVC